MNKKIRCLATLAALMLSLSSLAGCKGNKTTFLDYNGDALATLTDYGVSGLKSSVVGAEAYAEIAYQQAAAILAEQNGWDSTEAQQHLADDGYTIQTHFNPDVFMAVSTAYNEDSQFNKVEVGCAVTNHSGWLLAAFSSGSEEYNLAYTKTQPYSSIKPLSVYAPALEKGLIHWGSLYPDSPIKTVINEQGNEVAWPQNSTNIFLEKDVGLSLAISQSLNTVAVRCLLDYGVENSMTFLKENFNIPLEPEEALVTASGTEEVLGNIALGYLREGVTPVDMAGYYQIFANGGYYSAPCAIRSIQSRSGKTIFQYQAERKQVLKSSTTAVMNELLQGVVAPGGSGENAALENIEVAGKTGTGELGNWFVGVTPEYSCAVWHGNQLQENIAENLFSGIFKRVPDQKIHQFAENAEIYQRVFCCESGLLQAEHCTQTAMGWFERGSEPSTCSLH